MDNNQDMHPDEKIENSDGLTPLEIGESVDEGEMPQSADTELMTDSEPPKKGYRLACAIYDYAEVFALSIIAVIFIFSFCIRLCRVDGNSMNNTLFNNERIIASDIFYTPKQGDIVVFHLSNESYHEPLVKRVIATEGQTVEINMTDKIITVDGEVYADEHAYISGGEYKVRLEFNKEYIFSENGKVYFRATVPQGKIFVLGDNRNGSSDSRSERVGFVDADCVLGKAILRLKPFSVLAD